MTRDKGDLKHCSITLEEDFDVRIVNFHKGKDAIYYTLALRSRTCIVTERRFRQFVLLHEVMRRVLKDVRLPSLPSRFFQTNPERRMEVLGEYVQELSTLLKKLPGNEFRQAKKLFLLFCGARVERNRTSTLR